MAPSPRTQTAALALSLVGVEGLAFGESPVVDGGLGGAHAIDLRHILRGLGQHPRGMQAAARGDQLDGVDVGFKDAHVALGETGRGAAALLQFLIAGGRPGFDEQIADAELFDEAQGFLARAGADGEHPDDRADAEDDAERGQHGAGLLRPQVLGGEAEIGEIAAADHGALGSDCIAPPLEGAFFLAISIGSASATT